MTGFLTQIGWTAQQHEDLTEGQIYRKVFQNHIVDVLVPKEISPLTPVLVMHDGKNLFWETESSYGTSWGVIPALTTLKVQPVVIGVWGLVNEEFPGIRMFELAPQQVLEENPSFWGKLLEFAQTEMHALLGDEYHQMIAEEIIPEVTQQLGIQQDPARTALAGSSMGGITSLYGVSRYPQIYGTVLSLSTHLAFWDPAIITALLSRIPTDPRPRIWLDRGDQELDAQYEGLHEAAAEYLTERGWQPGVEFHAEVFYGTNHSEGAWRIRLPQILQWWLES
ncbi:MAG: hypothetical protein KGQ38_07840 [Actinomycetales bacterium]|nr:hypothetical protein [Actinomycetales bacterium]